MSSSYDSQPLPIHPARNQNPALSDLHNLTTGKIHTKDTSYVAEQNEVRDMITATQDKDVRWPGFWYELLQGAWDYNDWNNGPPHIDIYRQGETDPISLGEYVNDIRSGRNYAVDQVSVVNNIRDSEGLRPGDIVLTLHDQKTEEKTLGTHGRGLKIATTSACAGGLAAGITFESSRPNIGGWFGQASLNRDPVDSDLPPSLQLNYKRDPDLEINTTTITVHQPSPDALKALAQLPEWFLPTNPNYQHQRLEPAIATDIAHSNLFTIYMNEELAVGQHTTSLNQYEAQEMTGTNHNLSEAKGIEPPRIEIVPKEILSHVPPQIDFVFVDGLRVNVPGANFSQIFSFWGLGGNKEGYNPHRSNDSLRLEGATDQLLALTLGHCNNPQVFAEIIQANMSETATAEGHINPFTFRWELNYCQPALQALTTAWTQVLQNTQAPEGLHITSNKEAADRASREGIPVAFVNSRALVESLTKFVPNVTTVDSVFEKQAAAERQKHQEEVARLQQEKAEAIAKERATAAENLKNELKARGILQNAEATGEIMKVTNPENTQDSAEIARLHLLYLLGLNHGSVGGPRTTEGFVLNMEANDFTRLPNNTDDLGAVAPFIKNFLAVYGTQADLEVRVVLQGQGVFFRFARSEQPDNFGNLTISVQQGVTDMSDENLLQIIMYQKGSIGVVDAIKNDITQSIAPFLNHGGQVDRELYLLSEYYQQYPPAAAMIRTRRQLETARTEAQKALADINIIRKRAGLPLIQDPFSLPKSSTTTSNDLILKDELPQKSPENGRAFHDSRTIDDTPVVENVLRLIHPDSIPGISGHGKKHRREFIMDNTEEAAGRFSQSLADRAREALRRQVSPDFTLASGEFSRVRGYLISHFNPEHSEISTADYELLPDLDFTRRNGLTHLRYNKPITPGTNTLPCPPGYRPVAFYHSQEHPEIIFSGNLDRNLYAFSNQSTVPAGLTIYYEKVSHYDATTPDTKEHEVIADAEGLNDYWQNLINTINSTPSLTDKNKVDIILRAWTKAFNYDDSEDTFSLYTEVRNIPTTFTTEIINQAVGNCGYSARGFHGLLSLVGVASRDVACFLSDGFGNYTLSNSYHAINQPYIDGQWVNIEPQVNYLDPGYQIEKPPSEFRDLFDSLIDAIPEGNSKSPRLIDGLPEVLPQTMPPIRDLAGEIVEAVLESLPIHIRLPHPREIIGSITSSMDLLRGVSPQALPGDFKNALKIGAGGAAGLAVVAAIAPAVSNLMATSAQASEPIVNTIQNTPTEVVASPVVHNILTLPPEYIAAGILIGSGAFVTGQLYERRKARRQNQKTNLAQPSVSAPPAI